MRAIREWLETELGAVGGDEQLKANCPFCVETGKSPDRKQHLGISIRLTMPVFHCFRCGRSGTLVHLVSIISGMTYTETRSAVRFTGRMLPSIRMQDAYFAVEKKPRLEGSPAPRFPLPQESEQLVRGCYAHKPAWAYLDHRGVTEDVIETFELTYCSEGEFGGRLILPIRFGGQLVGFTSRTVLDEEPKYKFPKGFLKSDYLYNYDATSSSPWVVLVEGPFDVWRMPFRSVALFGKKLSDVQRSLVVKTWKRVYVMLDQDARGEAYEIVNGFSGTLAAKVALLRSTKDPWESSPVQIAAALREADGSLGTLLQGLS